jgi:hypothetical protein
MTDARMNRRLTAMLSIRLDDAGLDEVPDARDPRGVVWPLGTLLRAAVIGVAAGADSLAEVERFTKSMSLAMRRKLGIRRRVPDTTLRDNLCAIEPAALGPCIRALARAAHRRKALCPVGLPFGVVSMDGKGTALPAVDDYFAQRQTQGEDGPLIGVVRTVTTTLTSSPARPCIDVTPIPASTNEMGIFRAALVHLLRAYSGLDLFRVVTYDAGACSLDNAMAVREHNLHYVLGLTAGQPTLFEAAKAWLGVRPSAGADAASTDPLSDGTVVRRIYIGAAVEVDSPEGWETHLRTVLRVETETLDQKGNRTKLENRYLISSLANDRLSPEQWLLLVRRHWGVETTHQALDVAFKEDKHPWIKQNPRGMLVVAILRRIAYTLLSLFRSGTQRSDARRAMPWKDLFWDIKVALLATTAAQLAGLRLRPAKAPA